MTASLSKFGIISALALLSVWAILRSPFAGILWVLVAFAPFIFIICTIVFLALAIAPSNLQRRKFYGIAALLCVGGCALFATNRQFTTKVRFAVHRAEYEAKLALVLQAHAAGKPVDKLAVDDFAYLDEGPPLRVSFFWTRGLIDNWVGLVYDPTGEVMKANSFKSDWSNWNAPELQSVKMLFDGDIYRAQHLSDHWYLCWFT